ncbi:MAG: hypothetical protein ACFB9N_01995 [Geitlerinemataceae cyanobacterium]
MTINPLSVPIAIVLLVTGYLMLVRVLLSLMGRVTARKTSS